MKPYIEWTKEELVAEKARLEQEFAEVKAKGLNLNISRGKPAAAQLDLTEGMLTVLSKNEDTFAEDGTDCRNYGVLTGIPEARKLIGDICYRIEKSLPLLLERQASITSVAEQTGFSSPAYFSKIFRQQMGCSPSEYRNHADHT